MAQELKANIIILWEHELIAAAKALEAAQIAMESKETPVTEVNRLFNEALTACYAALYSPELASGCQVAVLSAKRAVSESHKQET